MIESRGMGWAGRVARMGEKTYRVWWGNQMDRDNWKGLGVDRRKILKRIVRNRIDWLTWTGAIYIYILGIYTSRGIL
jgi:hypothetical protein